MKIRIAKKLAKWYLKNPHKLGEKEVRKISGSISVCREAIITSKIISVGTIDEGASIYDYRAFEFVGTKVKFFNYCNIDSYTN